MQISLSKKKGCGAGVTIREGLVLPIAAASCHLKSYALPSGLLYHCNLTLAHSTRIASCKRLQATTSKHTLIFTQTTPLSLTARSLDIREKTRNDRVRKGAFSFHLCISLASKTSRLHKGQGVIKNNLNLPVSSCIPRILLSVKMILTGFFLDKNVGLNA